MSEKGEINALFARNLRALMNDSTPMNKPVRKGKTTQRELASYLGITPQAVSTYCNGVAMPDYSLLLKIAAFFGVSTDYLLTGIRPENKEAHELLGLSDEAIERLKGLHSDKEIEKKLLPLVDDILSNPEFYNLLHSAIIQLEVESKYFKHHDKEHEGGSGAFFEDYSVAHACDKMDFFFRGFFGRYKNAIQICDMVREITPLYLDMGDKG